jgi:adenylate kinase
MKIVLLGSPGVGKGTYASMIRDKYHLAHISTGDLFREAVAKGTELGKKAKEYMDKGALVPDELTLEILKERLEQKDAKNFLLDGFPRTIEQAKALDKLTKIEVVINFFASEKVILNRLGGRRICKKCGAIFHIKNRIPKKPGICDECQGELYQRQDEMPEVIKDRLKVYREKTKPLEDYYKKKGLLREIKAEVDMNAPNFKEEILDKIEEVLDKLK